MLTGHSVGREAAARAGETWLAYCLDEGVAGLVHQRLDGPLASAALPRELRDRFAAAARDELATELVRRREIAEVIAALDASGAEPVLIKGTALAYTIYGAPWLRPRADTDVIVPRRRVDDARRALEALGYVATNYCGGERLFGQFELARTDAHGIAHAFDLHWSLSTQSMFAEVLSHYELSSAAVPVAALAEPGAVDTRLPRAAAPVHALLLACIHPAMHHHNEERLIWLYDIDLLARSFTDADVARFGRLARSRGVATICAHLLAAAATTLGSNALERFLPGLRGSAPERSAVYLRPGRRWHHDVVDSLRGLPRWRERAQLVGEILLPAPRYMLASYRRGAGRRSAALLPALYVHRIVRGAWRVVTGRK